MNHDPNDLIRNKDVQVRRNSQDRATRRHQSPLLLIALAFLVSACVQEYGIKPGASDGLHHYDSSDIRVMSWNVKLSSVLPPNGVRKENFARIVRALDPDIIALQEVMAPDLAAQLTRLMNEYIPLQDKRSWQVHTVSDNAIISRFPMRWRGGDLSVPWPLPQQGQPDFHFGFAASLLDLSEGASLLVVAIHNKSGSDENAIRMRQVHADSIVRWFRNSRDSRQESSIPDNTPVVILGDMNAVPNASMAPLNTLVTGDIADEETFGPDTRIDWDGTDLADARPSHNALEQEYYTWRNDDLPFAPSALDRILYTDSVMSVRHRFVLNTMTLSPGELATLELQKSDVLFDGNPRYYDHLPLVVDFKIDCAPSD
jgi:endonuclease/exonuclease/phosphatase family metal-dependent hydrolase